MMDKMNLNSEVKENSKRFSWSKAQVLITGIIFVCVCGFVVYMYAFNNIENTYDTAALVTLISVSGAIFGSNLCWYSKKAAGENQAKIRASSFKDAAEIRLWYNVEMMKAMTEYKMDQDDLDIINSTGDMDEMMDSSVQRMRDNLDSNEDETSTPDTVETFNI